MSKPFHLLLHLILTLAWLVVSAFAQGDYSRIASLKFANVPPNPLVRDAFVDPCCCCDAMTVAVYVTTGREIGPLSPQMMMTYAGPAPYLAPTADQWMYEGVSFNFLHGFNSFNGADIAGRIGSCPESMCPPLTRRLTQTMFDAALPNRTAALFGTLRDVPDYPAAVEYLRTHHGSSVVLSSDSYAGAAIIGVDGATGKGIWLTRWNGRGAIVGQPIVELKSLDEGAAAWAALVLNKRFTADNYLVVMNPR